MSDRPRGSRVVALTLTVAAFLVTSCGGDGNEQATPREAATAPSKSGGTSPFIGSLTVDPGDGTLTIGTGLGLYRLAPGQRNATPTEGSLTAGSASGAVSPNLVLRSVAPGVLIASGHPKGGSALPEDLGLIRSEDGGDTWRSVSLLGEADLHALDVRGDRIIGHPAEEVRLLVSKDAGKSFEERVPPGLPIDVDLDPTNPDRVAITTSDGVYVSQDSGKGWRRRDVLAGQAHLAWAESGLLYSVQANGSVKVSEDGGAAWEERGNTGGVPSTATVDQDGVLYVAIAGGIIARSDDGGRSFKRLTQLRA